MFKTFHFGMIAYFITSAQRRGSLQTQSTSEPLKMRSSMVNEVVHRCRLGTRSASPLCDLYMQQNTLDGTSRALLCYLPEVH